jgi:transcriptional repressor NrdR
MAELYKLDKVAYIRFASVYKSFQDVEDFRSALHDVERPLAPKTTKKSAVKKPKSAS